MHDNIADLALMARLLWKIIPSDAALAQHLSTALDIPVLFGHLLQQRGIASAEAAKTFFKPSLEALHDPFLMKDMDIAVERLDRALKQGERILIYGDYDVDGTTSVAFMYAFLSRYYRNLDYYLPDRDKEGYGVSLEGVEYARANGVSLMLSIDCGIKSHAAIAQAKAYGIDFIVCDHHQPEGGLPDALANVDPLRPDCPYPFKGLSGCGIAFKLAQALTIRNQTPVEELLELLDLVAVSTACDIVPITGENRIITHFGLQKINHSPRIGLWALIQQMNRPGPIKVSDLVFGIGPMINSAGRLGDARDAVRLLLSADRNSAQEKARQLASRNRERRIVDQQAATEAREMVEASGEMTDRNSIVLYKPEWHKGIIGITASRISEQYFRPTVILTLSNDRAVGSARSAGGFDLYKALLACEDLFYSFGGHAQAAGMQMPPENVPVFRERFEQIVREHLQETILQEELELNAALRLEDINGNLMHHLRRFEPFGPGNRSPVFYARGLVDTGRSRTLQDNHVRLSLRQQDGTKTMNGIAFGLADRFEALKAGVFDIAFSIREEIWQGQRTMSIQVKDIIPAGSC